VLIKYWGEKLKGNTFLVKVWWFLNGIFFIDFISDLLNILWLFNEYCLSFINKFVWYWRYYKLLNIYLNLKYIYTIYTNIFFGKKYIIKKIYIKLGKIKKRNKIYFYYYYFFFISLQHLLVRPFLQQYFINNICHFIILHASIKKIVFSYFSVELTFVLHGFINFKLDLKLSVVYLFA